MLREDFMPDYGLTVAGLAEAVGVSRQSINELLRGRRAVSPEMALRLSCLFGNSAESWLNAERAVHFATGCGGRHRRSPTGGAANGMPLKEATPSATTPCVGDRVEPRLSEQRSTCYR
jgi:addiction module HigA family antidote